MIVLLSYSTSWSKDNCISLTGEVVELYDDSVLISIDDLRIANAKMIELEYEKSINKVLKERVINDSIIIQGHERMHTLDNQRHEATIKEVKRQRNILGGISITSIILLVISLL